MLGRKVGVRWAYVLDRLGSLKVLEKTDMKVVCGLSRELNAVGLLGGLFFSICTLLAFDSSSLFWVLPALCACMGFGMFTFRRHYVFDKLDGLLYARDRILGFGSEKKIPLFHLKAVIVEPRFTSHGTTKFVSRIEKRTGEDIFLDESKTPKRLVKIAKAIADVTDIRFEYETGHHSARVR